MEGRALLSTITVTSASDNGDDVDPVAGSLRAAILAADADTTPDTIRFNIGGGGHQVITLAGPLPALTNSIAVDGTSQPDYAGTPLVEIDGNGLVLRGLDLEAPNCVIKGLVINHIAGGGDSGDAIFVNRNAPGFVIQGNYIGTDATASSPVSVGEGIECYAASGQVGGMATGQGNVISGSNGYGLSVQDIFHVAIQGNFIGTNASGNAAIPNQIGIQVGGENGGGGGLIIGGTTPAARNIISGNVTGIGGFFAPESVVIEGNYIGTDVTGKLAVPNTSAGINGFLTSLIGGDTPGAGNLISGNRVGIAGVSGAIQGNLIGTDVTGTAALPNTDAGIETDNCTIGGTTPGARNVISGNGLSGIFGAHNDTIQGNYLGTDITGEVGLGGNADGELFVPQGCTVVGNVLSTGTAVAVRSPVNSTFKGNLIGTNKEGTGVIGNYVAFLMTDGASTGNVFGGTSTGDGNVVSGNAIGFWVAGSNPSLVAPQNDVIEGNFIGTDKTGTIHLGNSRGVYIDWGVSGITVGGNVIAYNELGVWIDNTGAGPDPFGVSILGNSIYGNTTQGINFLRYLVNNNYATIPNDPLDADTGPNGLQNYPVITSAYAGPSSIAIGTLNSTPGDTFRIEFYASPAGDPQGEGQAARYLGSYTTTASDEVSPGNYNFSVPGLNASALGEEITATATVLTGPNANSTSEISDWVAAAPLPPSSLSGLVYSDFNHDGHVDFGEAGIPGVTIDLDGTNLLGNPVHVSQTTDNAGTYVFQNLLPGSYTITAPLVPAGYTAGINTVGTGSGTVSGATFTVSLTVGEDAMNYNYGDQPAAAGSIRTGQTAGIGFWNNNNGQALIKGLNGGVGTQLGDWLAATFPHMFGAMSGSNDLGGKSNAYVASFFQSKFVVHGQKLDAQVLATALAIYVTDPTLDNTGIGSRYGFLVSGNGLATSTFNVGSGGAAFGVANNTMMTVLDILLAADAQAINGLLYNGNATKRDQANDVFSAINEAGD